MSFGFLKKLFFADNISPMVDEIFAVPYGLESFSVILGAIAFGVQIYGDFSGYSDIAIGAAMILGFNIPANFNKPYFACSPSDFWRKWHISLSSWLRDYLYVPLGGNRKSEKRTYFNLATVMFLGGLWHGASWNSKLCPTCAGSSPRRDDRPQRAADASPAPLHTWVAPLPNGPGSSGRRQCCSGLGRRQSL